jgi:hypothetical protein
MDRNRNLLSSLRYWLKVENIDEIIIVDWSSQKPLIKNIELLNDSRIKLIRVDKMFRWVLSWAYNLAVSQTTFDKVLKLDSDIILPSNFLDLYRLSSNSFFRGSWKLARNENENHLNGQVYFFRQAFDNINGYNERIVSYGFDDDDLYNRMSNSGVKRKYIKPKDIYHIPNEDLERIVNQQEFGNVEYKNINKALSHKIESNRLFCKRDPWLKSDVKKKWKLEKIKDNYFKASIC